MINRESVELIWELVKEYIPAKNRQGVADHIASELIDVLSDDDLKKLAGLDQYLNKAIVETGVLETDEEEEYDYE